MKIYFAGAIRGGREKVLDYKRIIDKISEYGEVLDKHVADVNLTSSGEKITNEEIYQRDINWLDEADVIFAEVTQTSLGVGYELGYAESKGKRIYCMYESDKIISGMIMGNTNFEHVPYSSIDELLEEIDNIFKSTF